MELRNGQQQAEAKNTHVEQEAGGAGKVRARRVDRQAEWRLAEQLATEQVLKAFLLDKHRCKRAIDKDLVGITYRGKRLETRSRLFDDYLHDLVSGDNRRSFIIF